MEIGVEIFTVKRIRIQDKLIVVTLVKSLYVIVCKKTLLQPMPDKQSIL